MSSFLFLPFGDFHTSLVKFYLYISLCFSTWLTREEIPHQLIAIGQDPNYKSTFQHSPIPPYLSSSLPSSDLYLHYLTLIFSTLRFPPYKLGGVAALWSWEKYLSLADSMWPNHVALRGGKKIQAKKKKRGWEITMLQGNLLISSNTFFGKSSATSLNNISEIKKALPLEWSCESDEKKPIWIYKSVLFSFN